MNKLRLIGACAVAVPLALGIAAPASVSFAQEALRPAVGKPLEKAKSLMQAHNYAAATAQVAIADKQKNKTPNEQFVIQEMRGAIAQASGDTATAAKVFADLIGSGRLAGSQLTQMLLAEVSLSYQMKDYKATIDWANRYMKAGGKDPAVRTLVIQSYYLQQDYANAAAAQKAQIDQELAAKKIPPEDQLQLLAACQKALRSPDMKATMEMLVQYYPKPDYWADLVYSLQTSPGFSDRLALDLDRFKLRLGLLKTEPEFMEATQLALGDNNPGKAQDMIAAANAAKVFGDPAKAAREQRLAALVTTTAQQAKASLDQNYQQLTSSRATTSQQLFDLGQQYCGFRQYDKCISLMQQAIAKGDLQRGPLAQLRLAEAYVDSGNKEAALLAFKQVSPTDDGVSDLANLWILWLDTQKSLQPV